MSGSPVGRPQRQRFGQELAVRSHPQEETGRLDAQRPPDPQQASSVRTPASADHWRQVLRRNCWRSGDQKTSSEPPSTASTPIGYRICWSAAPETTSRGGSTASPEPCWRTVLAKTPSVS